MDPTEQKGRKRSRRVEPLLVTAVAAMIVTGCAQQQIQTARCVDANGNVLPDSACQGGSSGIYYQSYRYPHWVYGGSGGTSVGSHATGYSTVPASGARTVTSSGSVVRGGFGETGAGHGSFGEGHGSFGGGHSAGA